MMTLIFFILYFGCALALSSLCMCGWYVLTRGEVYHNSEGFPRSRGKIFKGWHFFFTRVRQVHKCRVVGPNLWLIYQRIYESGVLGNLTYYINAVNTAILYEGIDEKEMVKKSSVLRLATDCEVDCYGGSLHFYTHETEYVFPHWLQSPLSECIYCFASLYGSVLYAGFFLLPHLNLFSWTAHRMAAQVFSYLLFLICSSALNGVLIKKVL